MNTTMRIVFHHLWYLLKHSCFFGHSLLSPDGQGWAFSQSILSQPSLQKYVVFRFSKCDIKSIVGSGVGSGVGTPGDGLFVGCGTPVGSSLLSEMRLLKSSPSLSTCTPQSSPSLFTQSSPSLFTQSSPSLLTANDGDVGVGCALSSSDEGVGGLPALVGG